MYSIFFYPQHILCFDVTFSSFILFIHYLITVVIVIFYYFYLLTFMLALMWLIHYLAVYLHWPVKFVTFCVFLLLLRTFSFQLRVSFCMADLLVTNFFTFCFVWSSLSLFYFWMLTLPSRVFLVGFLFSIALEIYPTTPFWPTFFCWREICCYSYGGSLVCYKLFLLLLLDFLFLSNFCHFNYSVSWCPSLWLLVELSWLAESGCLFPSLG